MKNRVLAGSNWTNKTNFGLIPEPFVIPQPRKKISLFGQSASSELPSSYDLRSQDKLTPIRNQGSCGSCWAFATCGSLESKLMPAENWDFSENNIKNLSGYDFECCEGGNRAMSTAYLARWNGPVAEADDPYSASSCTSPTDLTARKHLQDVIFIPDRQGPLDNDAFKNAIMEYGAVYTTFYWADACYNSSTYGYYCPDPTQANHAVCVVGWNDNYPASNFETAPAGNGAFLVRNSWGTWWGDQGYFWTSYHDVNFARPYGTSSNENAVFIVGPPDDYDKAYGYDDLGMIATTGYGSETAWLAIAFTAEFSGALEAVSWYSLADGTSYDLKICTSLPSKNSDGNPISGQIGTITHMGYHVTKLDTPVLLTSGSTYYCVLKLTTPGYTYPVAMECPIADYSSAASAGRDETWMSSDGTHWTDMDAYPSRPNSSVCMKAFVSYLGVPDIKTLADGIYVELDGKVVSAVFGDCIYVSERSMPVGIKVEAIDTGVSEGDIVKVTGVLSTDKPDGINPTERVITSALVTVVY